MTNTPVEVSPKDLRATAQYHIRMAVELLERAGATERLCRRCERPFLLEPGLVVWFQLKGLALPWTCKTCRDGQRGRGPQRPAGSFPTYPETD